VSTRLAALLLVVLCAPGPSRAEPGPDDEARARKARSLAILRAEGVPILEALPVIETANTSRRRTTEEVARRAMSLLVVAVKGEGLEQEVVERLVKDYGLAPHLSPAEAKFVGDHDPSHRQRVQFSWRYEAAWTLLWALGYVQELGKPGATCDVPRAVGFLKDRGAKRFVAEARLRPQAELLDQADRIYRYDWAVVDARVNGREPPAGLHPGVTVERHHALNWVIGYMDEAWDDVSTDT